MSFLSKLFVSKRSIDTAVDTGAKITDGILSGLDKIWHTEEEKSDARQKGNELILDFWKIIAHENTEQSKARRELATMTFKVFFFFLLSSAVVYGFDKEYATFLFNLAGVITFLVTGVAAIYFGPHQISKVWKKK